MQVVRVEQKCKKNTLGQLLMIVAFLLCGIVPHMTCVDPVVLAHVLDKYNEKNIF